MLLIGLRLRRAHIFKNKCKISKFWFFFHTLDLFRILPTSTLHYELPWGHRKIFELDESHTKWKFGASEEIIAAFFTKNTSKMWNLNHFTSPGFTQNSLFWLILFSKWNFDCSYLSWWVEFLPAESISKLSCYRRVCWYIEHDT